MISDKYKCIFIHIPKNAGTSIETKISSDEGLVNQLPDHRTILDLEPFSIQKILSLYQYEQFLSVLRRGKYLLNQKQLGSFYKPSSRYRYNQYFKFTIVRNPWSRLYSWFRNVMNDINHRKRYKVPYNCSFQDFVINHLNNHHAARSQFYWLTDSKEDIPMDFIGRFENLETDFLKVAQEIGLKDPELPKKRYTGKSASYIEAYDSVTKNIVWKKYKREIDYFGFEFGE